MAFQVLRDPERTRIYCDHGFARLELSETYAEESVMTKPTLDVIHFFYSGEDPEAREFMMLNGTNKLDDDGFASDDDDGILRTPSDGTGCKLGDTDSITPDGSEDEVSLDLVTALAATKESKSNEKKRERPASPVFPVARADVKRASVEPATNDVWSEVARTIGAPQKSLVTTPTDVKAGVYPESPFLNFEAFAHAAHGVVYHDAIAAPTSNAVSFEDFVAAAEQAQVPRHPVQGTHGGWYSIDIESPE